MRIKLNKKAVKHYRAAWHLATSGQHEPARQKLLKAKELEPEWAQPALLLGQIYAETGDLEAAKSEFRRVIECDPDWDEGYSHLARALFETGEVVTAIKAVRRAMKLAPTDDCHPVWLGIYLMRQQKYPKAIKMFRKGLKLKPHYGEADTILFLAEALLANGQRKAARKAWKRVLKLEPMYPSYKKPHKKARRMLKKHRRSLTHA